MVVTSPVVTDNRVPPELIEGEGTEQTIGVVQLVVVTDPVADESPCGLDGRVSTETSYLLRLATYKEVSKAQARKN